MFRADTGAMEECALEMQRQIRKWNGYIDETESIKSSLGHMSGMEGAAVRLGKQIEEMDALRRQHFQLMLGLRQIGEAYCGCERNVIDYAEGTQINRRQNFEWYQIRFAGNAADYLRQIIH